ncbi:hypothetical protein D3C72_2139820 [compost metagenome]
MTPVADALVSGRRGRADELAQLGGLGIGEEFGGRALFPDTALMHEDDLGRDVAGERHFMRDQHHRHA